MRLNSLPAVAAALCLFAAAAAAQQTVTETRDPKQQQDEAFAKAYAQWTSEPRYGSPLVDHLPKVAGIPTPREVLGYYIGAPKTLTYYADLLKYYRALAAATPRVQVETIGRSDEGRELVVVWVSSEDNLKNLARNRANLAKLADPRARSDAEIRQLIETTRPHYHLIGGLHSGETGPSEMLMELVYRLATETSPLITQIRNSVIVSVTPAAEPDGRDRNVDWFYRGLELGTPPPPVTPDSAARGGAGAPGGPGAAGPGGRGVAAVPYWGKYVYHDNNRDINLSQLSMRALTDWYYTAHPPIMHDLHEAQPLLYTYSGGPPQNPNLDPLLFAELPFFSNWELSQMTKWGMPGVYTHAFMDGWSPGYLGSVAYNHNGMMRMYETQSGRDVNLDSLRTAARTRRDSTRPDSAAASRPAPAPAAGQPPGGEAPPGVPFVRRPAVPTGRGGGQPREWYRGIPIPPNAANAFTRRNNTNYMETGVLSALQLTSMFPNLVLENFYVKTRNALEEGRTKAPYAYGFPLQRDMTRVVTLVNIFRAQGIEVGVLNSDYRAGADSLAAGSYVVKLDQPYGRLARNLLERQDYPDPALTTYDDSGWSMGYAMNVEVKEFKDKAILDAKVTPVTRAEWRGKLSGDGSAALAVAHLGSTNMITFRYRLKQLPMQVAEQSFTAGNDSFPAGSFILTGSPANLQAARSLADSLGLTAAALSSLPVVRTHDADVPRVAIYSQWNGTQELGWYRHAFDQFGIPFDLIYKERVQKGNLKADYDVILMAAQNINRAAVLAAPAAKPQPYQKSAKYQFLGMYGETPDMTGGFGELGVTAFEQFLAGGGTLIATLGAVRFPIEFGFAHTVDTESPTGVTAQKPLIQAEIKRVDHPVFYGYAKPSFPVKFGQGSQVFRVGIADQGNILAQYKGGDASVLSGLMVGADNLKGRAFAVDVPNAFNGKGRVLLFANNPIYRWQNHGEFNLIFNAILNWNDVPAAPAAAAPARAAQERPPR
jgi:zinc carboxypeptidase